MMLVIFGAKAVGTLYSLRNAVYNLSLVIPHMKRTESFVDVTPLMSAHCPVPQTDDSNNAMNMRWYGSASTVSYCL